MRLFFALWPGERVRERLAAVSAVLAGVAEGKAVAAEKVHLTLAFLGEVAPDRLEALRDAARAPSCRRFEMSIDEVGSFRRARVAWAGPSVMPEALLEFQMRLDRALRERGFALEERPFAPHLTLVRKIARPVARAPIPAIRWRPRALVLVESIHGTGRYEVRETWEIGGRRD